MAATPEEFYDMCTPVDPTQAIQFLQNIPLDERHPFVSSRSFVGTNSLHAPATAGHFQLVQLLVASGADKNAANNNGATPFYIAAQNGNHQVVEVLVAAGADINAAAKNDRATPIYFAAQNGHHQVVEMLPAACAGINAAMNDGRTPILIAAYKGDHQVVEVLVAAGADEFLGPQYESRCQMR